MSNIVTGTSATTALVPVFTGTIQSQPVQLCDARTLHTFMLVLRDFSNWIKGRIIKFGFINGVDFVTVSRSPDLASGNRGASIDYHLTLDMAKELSMVENNAKGREARRYFIEQEKLVLAGHFGALKPPVSQPDRIAYTAGPTDTLTAAQAEQLRLIFKDKCDKLPADKQAAFMTKGWSKLKSHFGCTYRKIEQREFSEAVSLATRHAGEWEALDAPVVPALAAPIDRTEQMRDALYGAAVISSYVQLDVARGLLAGRDDWAHQRYLITFVADNAGVPQPVVERLMRSVVAEAECAERVKFIKSSVQGVAV